MDRHRERPLRRTRVHRSGHSGHPSRRCAACALAALLALASAGCGERVPSAGGAGDAMVTIDGERIHADDFRAFVDRTIHDEEVELDDETLSRLFDDYLDHQLLVRLAIERGMVDGAVDPRRAVTFLVRDRVPAVDEAEARAYYEAHRSDYEHPERLRLRQILVSERSTAEEARAALDNGESFAEVAARLSQGPKAHLGGDQGLLARDDLPERFADVVFTLEDGESSPIVENDYGFQIFHVVERRPAESVPFDEALPDVRQALERRRIDEAVAAAVAEARERYNVRLFPSQIPFDYRGSYAPSDDPP